MALKNEESLKELASKEPAIFNEVFLNFQMDLFDHENELKKLKAVVETRGALTPEEKKYESVMTAKKAILESVVEDLLIYYKKR
ncbi:MAG TPA: hypothetical protein P5107_02835 [Thermotogota bacterium]|nr:hypothetical protein [Thermotogota bacterium]HRW33973.1 hypothetical protein [Thermotogota bacterium]